MPPSLLLKFMVTLAPAGTEMVLRSKDILLATISIVTFLPDEGGLVVVDAGGVVEVAGAVEVAGEDMVGLAVVVVGAGVVVVTAVVVVGGVVTAAVLGEAGVDEQAAAANIATAARDTANVRIRWMCRIISPLLCRILGGQFLSGNYWPLYFQYSTQNCKVVIDSPIEDGLTCPYAMTDYQ
jgi:hypothetical protein